MGDKKKCGTLTQMKSHSAVKKAEVVKCAGQWVKQLYDIKGGNLGLGQTKRVSSQLWILVISCFICLFVWE